ncbi:MAG: hypothetical protein MPL62_11600, partial [Alphaproteobacteria bacterium]|nr:hypothetical protein [Alphaproteobacteria bacterium]
RYRVLQTHAVTWKIRHHPGPRAHACRPMLTSAVCPYQDVRVVVSHGAMYDYTCRNQFAADQCTSGLDRVMQSPNL